VDDGGAPGGSGRRTPPNFAIGVRNPADAGGAAVWPGAGGAPLTWQRMAMIANLPHLAVRLPARGGGAPQEILMMLDSGAGGADLMFHGRAVKTLDLPNPRSDSVKFVRGVGGAGSSNVKAWGGEFSWAEVAGVRFAAVRCLLVPGILDVSLYSAGIICADLMTRGAVVLDYARRRVALQDPNPPAVPPPDAGPPAGGAR